MASQLKPLVLLCDGTWCGRETSTRTNIYRLAEIIGIPITNPNTTDEYFMNKSSSSGKNRKGRYIHGVGLNSTFLDYVFNAITAQDIAEQCISAYKYIVQNYVHEEYEIWMFGLSRGAYTVRCIAGMINNCGILKRRKLKNGELEDLTDDELDLLCREVYRIYRSPYEIDSPHSEQSLKFRKTKSWPLIGDDDPSSLTPTKAPIRFMGLFDTVGELGIPSFTGGVGLDYPKFYSENVSSVVEHVYQATSLHDRLYVFQPCLARRNPENFPDPKKWNIREKWFPGCHYDLGRQRFKFFRDAGGVPLESWLARLGWVSKVIEPNEVLSDLVLRWMLKSIKEHDGESLIVPEVGSEIEKLERSITSPNPKTGSGDVYNRALEYAPFGKPLLGIWRTISGDRSHFSAIYELLLARRDRHIPDDDAVVYDYTIPDPELPTTTPIQTLARIDPLTGNRALDEPKRYPSMTRQAWLL
ncbi:hypothetical protein BGZ60DRAFT_401499 [Tricladium varicosporioides]|nr:hypothetical protein BGZ60DRAFT_401499 [Hymenoscyphus varicosporioides]